MLFHCVGNFLFWNNFLCKTYIWIINFGEYLMFVCLLCNWTSFIHHTPSFNLKNMIRYTTDHIRFCSFCKQSDTIQCIVPIIGLLRMANRSSLFHIFNLSLKKKSYTLERIIRGSRSSPHLVNYSSRLCEIFLRKHSKALSPYENLDLARR